MKLLMILGLLFNVAIKCADSDFALNLLRYGEVRLMQVLLSSALKGPRVKRVRYGATVLNYLVRNGYFAKPKDARLMARRHAQRGMRKEGDETGRTPYEVVFAAALYQEWHNEPIYESPRGETLAITRVIYDD